MAASLLDAIQGIVGPSMTETTSRSQGIGAGNSPTGMHNHGSSPSSNENQHFPFHPSTNSRHNSASSSRHISGHVRARSDASSRHHSRQSSAVDIELNLDNDQSAGNTTDNNDNVGQENGMEFLSTLTWVQRGLPFVVLLLLRVLWDHRLGNVKLCKLCFSD